VAAENYLSCLVQDVQSQMKVMMVQLLVMMVLAVLLFKRSLQQRNYLQIFIIHFIRFICELISSKKNLKKIKCTVV